MPSKSFKLVLERKKETLKIVGNEKKKSCRKQKQSVTNKRSTFGSAYDPPDMAIAKKSQLSVSLSLDFQH